MTDPGRYAPLHAAARELLAELEHTYEVRREEGTTADPGGGAPVPLVRLVPADPEAAALEVVATRFPGLLVRRGRDRIEAIPVCGCDACDETLPDCLERLKQVAEATTGGTSGERLVHGDAGWVRERWLAMAGGWTRSRTPLSEAEPAAARAALPTGERAYAPWPRRRLSS